MRKLHLSMLVFGIALAGCGSDEPFGFDSPDVTQITVSSSDPTIPSDGSSSATITAFARDASNNLIANVPITFTASSGGLAVSNGSTNASGEATATLNTAGDSSIRTIIIIARSGSLTASTTVSVVAPAPAAVSMSSFGGKGTLTLTVSAPQGDGNAAESQQVYSVSP